jgi:hypothetical protein
MRIKVTPFAAWFDLWVGVYINTKKRRIYIMPIPCFGVYVQLENDDDEYETEYGKVW